MRDTTQVRPELATLREAIYVLDAEALAAAEGGHIELAQRLHSRMDALAKQFDELELQATYSDTPDPTPLPSELPPVAKFDPDLLPEALRGLVTDISHRMQCPPDFAAVGAMVGISSLVGARAVIKPKAHDDWAVVPNLWGSIVGRPGVMKSPNTSETLKPLARLEAAERDAYEVAMSEWELDSKVAEMAREANTKQAKSLAAKDPTKARELLRPVDTTPPPVARRYIVNDSTVERLGELLQKNPWGLLMYRDELHGLLTSLDKQGQEGARAFYLQGYDGNQGYTFDRIGRGETRIERVCFSMLGGIQPGKLQSYVREAVAGGAGDDGLLQRFGLMVWPDVSAEFEKVDRWPDAPARQQAYAVFERLNELKPSSDKEPQVWSFDDAAQSIYWEWCLPFERELRGDALHPALVSHLAKYRKLVPALALLFALIDAPNADNKVGAAELLRSLAWTDYLRSHAERVYAAAVVPETASAQTLLTKLKTGRLTGPGGMRLQSFTPREVAVKHWAGLGSVDDVRKAASTLADYGWLERELLPSGVVGGRPSERFLLHPVLLKGGAA